ncbi:MAG: universal stress protein [Nocardioidaceae bacterium]
MDDVATSVDIRGGIVVGHDGSRHSDRALQWAADWAVRTGCDLYVVRTWTLSSAPRPDTWSTGYVPPLADFERGVRQGLERDAAALDLPSGIRSVTCHVLHGPSARLLLEASAHADLLVVSARGRGGFAGLVMGSTTDQMVRHAGCPVVVIPAHALDDEPAEADRAALDG